MSQSTDQYLHNYLNDPDSALFESNTVTRFMQEGEQDFAADYPCILTRIALDVTAGVDTYTLPDNTRNIRRITWRGTKVNPLPHRMLREAFPGRGSSSKPLWYIYNDIGLNQIKFFPSPTESLGSTVNDLYGIEIPNRVIVEYYKMPDFNSATIPLYFRRRLLKTYVMRCCFNIEGQGQNLKNAKYYKARYDYLKQKYGSLLETLHSKPRKLVVGNMLTTDFYIKSPILPMDRFGVSVEAGE